jgi:hypothetical protein
MNTLSDEQLKELEGLYQKATQGKWRAKGIWLWPGDDSGAVEFHGSRPDAELAASLHNAFPGLLSAIQSLRAQVQQWKAAHEADKSVNASLRAELAAAKERIGELEHNEAAYRQSWEEVKAQAIEASNSLNRAKATITSQAQPPQSPWRPKFKVGDKVLIGIESKVNEIDEIWQPDTSKSPAYHLKGKGYFTEGEMSPAPQPPTKGEES